VTLLPRAALLHPKKERTVKDEVLPSPLPKRLYLRIPKKKKLVIPLPPLKKEKAWLELELELQAAYHRSVTGQAALLSRFFKTAPPAGDRFTAWWSAIDNNNVIDLDERSLAPAPTTLPRTTTLRQAAPTRPSISSLGFIYVLVYILQTMYKFKRTLA
jgi:hypothetical protein